MKKSLAAFILLLLPTVGWAQERVKIGFIDIQRAISDSVAGNKAKERFREQVKKVEADLMKEKHELERLKAEMDKKGPLLKEEERRSMEMDLQRRYVGYQRSMQDSQQELRLRENALTADILKDLEKVVNEVGKAEKFTLILERTQVLYSDQGIDITNKVLELYNSRSTGKASQPK